MEVDVADAIRQHLVGVPVDHGHGLEGGEESLHLVGVVGPEIPGLVDLVERRVREDHDRRFRRDLREVVLQPLALRVAHGEAPPVRVVELGHGQHPLHGGELGPRPEVLVHDRVEDDQVDALVLEGVGRLAEEVAPFLAQVEIPVVLAHHHPHGGLERLQDLGALFELLRLPELGEIAAVQDEVRLRVQGVDVVHGLQDRADEALVERSLEEVAVGDIGEAEALLRRVGVDDVHGLERVGQGPPGGGGDRGGHSCEAFRKSRRPSRRPGSK